MSKEFHDSKHKGPFSEIRKIVNEAVHRNMAEGILFSAGTDTSIIAFEAVKYKPALKAITVEFEHGNPKDTLHVKRMVKFLNLDHKFLKFDHSGMVAAAEKVVKILKTFNDMEIRNSIPVYIGLVELKKKGIQSAFTGDGLDELFGYPWQFHLSNTEFIRTLSFMWDIMRFSSSSLGKAVDIAIKQPYLDLAFMEYAKKIPIEQKVNMKNGVQYGKWLLREAYDGLIPEEVVWRSKAPCEQGTGTDILPIYFEERIATAEFENKRKLILNEDLVKLSTKEQLFYYEIFRKEFGKPSEVYKNKNGKQCPNCKGYVNRKIKCCSICGAYPI